MSGQAIVIVAPAGYGKTTLVEEALATTHRRAAWVRCTPADRHADRLLSSIVRAVDDAVPGSSEVIADARDGGQPAPDPGDGVRALLAECDRLLVDPIVIVIDDAENLTESEGACAIVDELVRDTGSMVGVALLSRRALPLRLAKPRHSGRLVELGIGDLAFDASECSDLVARAAGRNVSTDEVDGLLTATEGWPMGIATLVSGGDPGDGTVGIERPFRSPNALREYLREEVLAPLAEPLRTTLLCSAVPRRLTPAVAVALDLPDDHLAGAGTRGLFLQRLAGGSNADGWSYAYHPLFREALLDQLSADLTDAEIRDVHRRVAPAVAAHDPVEAIEHRLAAQEWSSAIDAIVAETGASASMSTALVRGWLDQLPDSHRADARVDLMLGHLAWADGRFDVAIEHLRAGLAAGPAADVDRQIEWWARFRLVDCLGMIGRPDDGVPVVDGFDRPDVRAAGPIAAAAALYAAHGIASAGRPADALDLAARVNDLPEADRVAPIDALLRAYIDVPAGRLAEAADRTLAAYRQVEHDDPLSMRLNLMAAHATVLGEQGHRDQAFEWWERQRVQAERALLVARVDTIRGLQAMLLAQSGRSSDAENLLALRDPTGTWADQSAYVARALLAAADGDRASTIAAAQHAIAAASVGPPLYRWSTLIEVVPALVTVGAHERAATVLDAAAALVDDCYPGATGRHLVARTTIRRAALAIAGGDIDQASELVADGLRNAGETAPDIVRLEWGEIGPAVSTALENGTLSPAATIECLWTAFPDGAALVELASHPVAAVRRSAFRPALASGNPTARAVVTHAVDDADPTVARSAADAVALVAMSPPPRRFESLGGFRIRRGGWSTDDGSWTRPADARLVRFLLVHGETPVPTDLLFDALWPDLDSQGARRSLQVSASRVRKLLDDPGPSPSIIDAGPDTYRLRLSEGDVLDWQQFERAAAAALDATTPSLRLLEHAHSLWGGEPLPEERYSDWAASWRARLVDRCVDVLVALVGVHSDRDDHAAAIRIARELVDIDPYDERSHRLLMAALARSGRRGQALRQFLVCRRMLLEDLGVEPSAATSALRGKILDGGPL
ncbi:ATP/maltotriose-dependent transcriptional regulator MalT [Ilumatobacter fluminis]|uniref:ATP/maltotriose-dependent transcriptional regulator MalT n=2 Tax=Ilumatobacter fluminis TaxID=467091 RepID=A0A4R7I5B7_9ACTN|nr:ATP/maltotriose-dependent transcriptional regulator MalT [Ilumatobacter fluminis]